MNAPCHTLCHTSELAEDGAKRGVVWPETIATNGCDPRWPGSTLRETLSWVRLDCSHSSGELDFVGLRLVHPVPEKVAGPIGYHPVFGYPEIGHPGVIAGTFYP